MDNSPELLERAARLIREALDILDGAGRPAESAACQLQFALDLLEPALGDRTRRGDNCLDDDDPHARAADRQEEESSVDRDGRAFSSDPPAHRPGAAPHTQVRYLRLAASARPDDDPQPSRPK